MNHFDWPITQKRKKKKKRKLEPPKWEGENLGQSVVLLGNSKPNIWKFYLNKTRFTLDEPVSLVKVFVMPICFCFVFYFTRLCLRDRVLGLFGKLSMRKGALAWWFHGIWTCGAKVLEYWMISSLKIKLN
jgi:hypothetical protein